MIRVFKAINCPACGVRVATDALVCPVCGARISSDAPIPPILKEPFDSQEARPASIPEAETTAETMRVPRILGLGRNVTFEDAPDEEYLKGYSYGPGCGLYFFNRLFWPYILWKIFLDQLYRAVYVTVPETDPVVRALILFLASIPSLILLVVIIRLGRTVRRKRWEGLPWKSFSHFKSEERDWNILGIFGWIGSILLPVLFVLFLVYYS
jgi:hypothetical protein